MSATHHVCAPCRRVVKSSRIASVRCSHCGRMMIDMGAKFRSPKKSNDRAWRRETRDRVLAQVALTIDVDARYVGYEEAKRRYAHHWEMT